MSKTTIEYKGVVTNVEAGHSAVVKCGGCEMEEEVIVRAGQGGGETAVGINGIIREYEVNAGAAVNAGDFVEFVSKWGSNNIFDDTSNASAISACKLGTNSVLILYQYKTDLRAVVCTIEGNTVVTGTETTLRNGIASTTDYTRISSVALTDSKVLIAYQYDTSLYGIVCTIEGSTVVRGTEIMLYEGGSTFDFSSVSLTALTDNKVLVSFIWQNKVRGAICTIEGTAITKGTVKELTNSAYKSSTVKLTVDKVFIAFTAYNGSNIWLYGIVCTIDGTTITPATSAALKYAGTNVTQTYVSAVALTDSKVFVAYGYKDNSFYGIVCNIEGTAMQVGTESVLAYTEPTKISAVALTDSKVFVSYIWQSKVHGVIYTIEGTKITGGTPTPLEEGRLAIYDFSIVTFSSNSVFIVSTGSLGVYIGVTIEGDSVSITSESEQGIGTYVQPATSNLHNVGVAKTAGTEGEIVQVYCVGNGTENTTPTGTTFYIHEVHSYANVDRVVEYHAGEGMTWQEWVDSEYNNTPPEYSNFPKYSYDEYNSTKRVWRWIGSSTTYGKIYIQDVSATDTIEFGRTYEAIKE